MQFFRRLSFEQEEVKVHCRFVYFQLFCAAALLLLFLSLFFFSPAAENSKAFNVSLDPELPSFLKTPMDLTIRTGAMARLECAAEGHPTPQISWQKDGGTDFPAARERRMHVMPEDDVFFIANVKIEDMGIYSCMAQNAAGGLSANATLTVLGKRLLAWII